MKDKEGSLLLGIQTPMGFMPFMTFSNLEELRRFVMGLLGYVEYFRPSIPSVWTKAFEEDKDGV